MDIVYLKALSVFKKLSNVKLKTQNPSQISNCFIENINDKTKICSIKKINQKNVNVDSFKIPINDISSILLFKPFTQEELNKFPSDQILYPIVCFKDEKGKQDNQECIITPINNGIIIPYTNDKGEVKDIEIPLENIVSILVV